MASPAVSTIPNSDLRRIITKLVHNEFPGCEPDFVGRDDLAGPRTREFGFRILGPAGRPRTGVICLDPSFYNKPSREWLRRAASEAGSRIER